MTQLILRKNLNREMTYDEMDNNLLYLESLLSGGGGVIMPEFLPLTKKVLVVHVGDSLTKGIGSSFSSKSFTEPYVYGGYSYPEQMYRMFNSSNYSYLQRGYPGMTAEFVRVNALPGILQEVAAIAANYDEVIFIVWFGANDLGQMDTDTFWANLKAFHAQIKAAGYKTIAVPVMNFMTAGFNQTFNDRRKAANVLIDAGWQTFADGKITLQDNILADHAPENTDFFKNPDQDGYGGGHLWNLGYKSFATEAYKTVQKMVGNNVSGKIITAENSRLTTPAFTVTLNNNQKPVYVIGTVANAVLYKVFVTYDLATNVDNQAPPQEIYSGLAGSYTYDNPAPGMNYLTCMAFNKAGLWVPSLGATVGIDVPVPAGGSGPFALRSSFSEANTIYTATGNMAKATDTTARTGSFRISCKYRKGYDFAGVIGADSVGTNDINFESFDYAFYVYNNSFCGSENIGNGTIESPIPDDITDIAIRVDQPNKKAYKEYSVDEGATWIVLGAFIGSPADTLFGHLAQPTSGAKVHTPVITNL